MFFKHSFQLFIFRFKLDTDTKNDLKSKIFKLSNKMKMIGNSLKDEILTNTKYNQSKSMNERVSEAPNENMQDKE